jgi:hypothetical protein
MFSHAHEGTREQDATHNVAACNKDKEPNGYSHKEEDLE